MLKISFTGDIVCDRPLLAAAKSEEGFDFDEMFENAKGLFEESDIVVGALETTFSGEKEGYNSKTFAYNSPDVLAETMKNVGINALSVASNHCMDFGADGILRTRDLLDSLGFYHTGTGKTDKPYIVMNLAGIRVALLSYTATMNPKHNAKPFSDEEKSYVNFLTEINPPSSAKQTIKRLIPTSFKTRLRRLYYDRKIKKGIPTIREFSDNGTISERDNKYIESFIEAANSARTESDIIIACVHSGGQFNREPGNKSIELYNRIAPFVDAIIGNHPHVIQRLEPLENGGIKAYSLGTMNLSLSADYISFTNLPQYSMLLNLYIDEASKRIEKMTYSILVAEEDEDNYVRVYPLDEYYAANADKREIIKKEMTQLLSTIGGSNIEEAEIRREYTI